MTVGNTTHRYLTGGYHTSQSRIATGTTSSRSNGSVVSFGRVWSGTDNLRWREMCELQVNCLNPYTCSRTRFIKRPNGVAYAYHRWNAYNGSGKLLGVESDYKAGDPFELLDLAVPVPSHSTQLAALESEVAGRWYQKAQEALSPLAGGQTFGELGQTLRQLVSPGKSLRRLLEEYLWKQRKLIRKVPPKTLHRALHDTYLEAMFGWRPLLSDIEGAIETMTRQQPPVLAVRARKTVRFNATSSSSKNTWLNSLTLSKTISTVAEVKVKCYGLVNCTPVNTGYPQMEKWGLSQEQFLPTAWELLPWSFVIDYFLNIGAVIQAYSFRRSAIVYSGTTTVMSNVRGLYASPGVNRLSSPSAKTNYIEMSDNPITAIVIRETVNRKGGVVLPSVQFTIPGSSIKWTNLTMLLYQARTGVKPPKGWGQRYGNGPYNPPVY